MNCFTNQSISGMLGEETEAAKEIYLILGFESDRIDRGAKPIWLSLQSLERTFYLYRYRAIASCLPQTLI